MTNRARRNYIHAISQRVDRKKMYKAKKQWIVAGMSFLVAMGLGAVASHTNTHASTVNNNSRITATLHNRINNNRNPQTDNITNQAKALHSRILASNAINNDDKNTNDTNGNVSQQTNQSNQNSKGAQVAQKQSASSNVATSTKALNSVNNVNNTSSKAQSSSQNASSNANSTSINSQSNSIQANNKTSQLNSSAINTSNQQQNIQSGSTNAQAGISSQSARENRSNSVVSQSNATSTNNTSSSNSSSNNTSAMTQPKTPSMLTVGGTMNAPQIQVDNGGNPANSDYIHDYTDTQDIWKDPGHDGMSLRSQGKWDTANVNYYSDGDHGHGVGDLMEVSSGQIDNSTETPSDLPFDNSDANQNWRLKIDPGVSISDSAQTDHGDYFSNTGASQIWGHFKSMDLSGLNTSGVTNFSSMFQGDNALQNVNVSNFDTSSAQALSDMFASDRALKHLNINNFHFNDPRVATAQMFSSDVNLESIAMQKFNITNRTESDAGMFDGTNNLNKILLGSDTLMDASDANSDQSAFFENNVDANGNVSTNTLEQGQPITSGWYYKATVAPIVWEYTNDGDRLSDTGATYKSVVSPDSNYNGSINTNVSDVINGLTLPNGYTKLPRKEQNYGIDTNSTFNNGNGYIPVLINDEQSDNYAFVLYDNTQLNDNGGLVNGQIYTLPSEPAGKLIGISNDTANSEIPQGYKLMPGASLNMIIGDTKDNYQHGKAGDLAHGVPAYPGYHMIFVTYNYTGANYVVNDQNNSQNGQALSNTGRVNGYPNQTSDDIDSSNEPNIPDGYHLVHANNEVPFNNQLNNTVDIIGNAHNTNSDNHPQNPNNNHHHNPSDNPINPSSDGYSDQVTVHVHKFRNGQYQGSDTKYIAVSGLTGDGYTVTPQPFDPTGYTTASSDQNLTGTFLAHGITNNQVTWNYNANALDTNVNYVVQDSSNPKNGQTLGSHHFDGFYGDPDEDITSTNDPGMPAGYQLVKANNDVPFDNGTHNIGIIGKTHNPGNNNHNPSDNKPTDPSDMSDTVTVTVQEYRNNIFQRQFNKYVAVSGRTGDKYTVSPNGFTPMNYSDESSNQPLNGYFTATGISAPNVTWKYNKIVYPVRPLKPRKPSDHHHPMYPSDIPNNPGGKPVTPSDNPNNPYDPDNQSDTFYVTIKDWSGRNHNHLVREYMKRMTEIGPNGSHFFVSPYRFETYGYNKVRTDHPVYGTINSDNLSPNHVTWNYVAQRHVIPIRYIPNSGLNIPQSDDNGGSGYMTGFTDSDINPIDPNDGGLAVPKGYHLNNPVSTYHVKSHDDRSERIVVDGNIIRGHATVHLVYENSDGSINSTKDVNIPIDGHVGGWGLNISPYNYEKAFYIDHNNFWFVPLLWNVAPNGNNLNYNPTHTFVYRKNKASHINGGGILPLGNMPRVASVGAINVGQTANYKGAKVTKKPMQSKSNKIVAPKAMVAKANPVASPKKAIKITPRNHKYFSVKGIFKVARHRKVSIYYEVTRNHKNYFISSKRAILRNNRIPVTKNSSKLLHKAIKVRLAHHTVEYRITRHGKRISVRHIKRGRNLRIKDTKRLSHHRIRLTLMNDHYVTVKANAFKLIK